MFGFEKKKTAPVTPAPVQQPETTPVDDVFYPAGREGIISGLERVGSMLQKKKQPVQAQPVPKAPMTQEEFEKFFFSLEAKYGKIETAEQALTVLFKELAELKR